MMASYKGYELEPSQEGKEFYVSVRDGKRHGLLLGPYPTHEEAIDNLERGKKQANDANPWAAFYGFGTCSAKAGTNLATVFGR